MSAFYDLYEFDKKKPQVVSQSTFKKAKGIVIYRGFNCNTTEFCNYSYEFVTGKFQRVHRMSALGNGIYFATNKSYANFYTKLPFFNRFLGSNILSAKINDDAKFASPKTLSHEFFRDEKKVKKLLNQKLNNALSDSDLEFLYCFILNDSDHMVKAVILGYDALSRKIIQQKKGDGQIVVVYNREKVLINEKSKFLKDEPEK